jgi:uncharacterized membrane protein
VGFTLTSGIGKGFSDVRDETEVEELPTTFEDLSQKSDDELREMLITLRKERREVPVAKAKATRQKAASTAKAKDTGGLPKVDLSKLSDEDKAALRAALMGILKEGLG